MSLLLIKNKAFTVKICIFVSTILAIIKSNYNEKNKITDDSYFAYINVSRMFAG